MTNNSVRILLIARHYPPLVSGGSRRVKLMAQALRDLGAEVCILAPVIENDPNGLAVPHPQPQPNLKPVAQKTSIKDIARTLLLYPDPDIRWSLRAVKAALKQWPEGFDWVITTSPPESVHVAGQKLSEAWGCKWMADFRDFWLQYPLYQPRENPLRQWFERRLAKRILSRASLLTCVLPEMVSEIEGFTTKSVFHLPNFADKVPKKRIDLNAGLSIKSAIHIVYTGAFVLSDPDRTIDACLNVFEAAHMKNPKLVWHIAGPLLDTEVDKIQASSVAHAIKLHGRVPYEQVRAIQASAHALLITAPDTSVAIPGKLEEYFTTGLPIIAVGKGPWKVHTGFEGDPIEALASLTNVVIKQDRPPVFTPDLAAEKILGWMKDSA